MANMFQFLLYCKVNLKCIVKFTKLITSDQWNRPAVAPRPKFEKF